MFDELVLSAMTHPSAPFHDRVRAAAKHGYSGIGLRPRDLRKAREAGHADADLRAFLDDHGIDVVEVEVVFGWGGTDEQVAAAQAYEAQVFDVADTLGGRYLTVVSDLEGPRDRSVELLAGLCDRAAEHGLVVALEFLPWTSIPSAAVALDLVEATGRDARILVDTWHHFRGADDWDQLRALPPERVATIQFDDAAAPSGRDPLEETFDRLLPGDGVFDLGSFLRVMAEVAPDAPLCLEVISPALDALPVDEAARRCMEATRNVLAEAFPEDEAD